MSEHSVRTAPAGRAQILRAAARVIGRDGIAQVKSAVVAHEAGVSVGLVHYHFETLDKLAREAFLYADGITLREMAEAAGSARSGREELSSRLVPWLEGTEEFEEAWQIWGEFWHASRHDDAMRELLRDAWNEWLQLIVEAIDRGKADGSIPAEVKSTDAARRLAALLESLGQQRTTGLTSIEDARRILRDAIEMEFSK